MNVTLFISKYRRTALVHSRVFSALVLPSVSPLLLLELQKLHTKSFTTYLMFCFQYTCEWLLSPPATGWPISLFPLPDSLILYVFPCAAGWCLHDFSAHCFSFWVSGSCVSVIPGGAEGVLTQLRITSSLNPIWFFRSLWCWSWIPLLSSAGFNPCFLLRQVWR